MILKGLDLASVDLNWPTLVTDDYKREALEEARGLVNAGVLPYPVSAHEPRPLAPVQPAPDGAAPKPGDLTTRSNASPTGSLDPYDSSRVYERPGEWFDLLDNTGRGWPQDMDFVCRRCGHRVGVGHPEDPPPACPACGN